jgi:hypothetical protein
MEYLLSTLVQRGRGLPLIDRVSAVAGTIMLQREIPWRVVHALDKWLCHGFINISSLPRQDKVAEKKGRERGSPYVKQFLVSVFDERRWLLERDTVFSYGRTFLR